MAGKVDVYIDGTRVINATKYGYKSTYDNDKQDTFDGKDKTQGDPEYTVTVSRIHTVNTNFENILRKAIAKAESQDSGIPIVIKDKRVNLTVKCTGCIIESQSTDGTPKSKPTKDFSFTASKIEES